MEFGDKRNVDFIRNNLERLGKGHGWGPCETCKHWKYTGFGIEGDLAECKVAHLGTVVYPPDMRLTVTVIGSAVTSKGLGCQRWEDKESRKDN